MSQQELLNKVVKVLDEIKLQYMLTGSFASSMQGEPRSTHDVDLVVAIHKSKIKKLVEAFPPPDYYLDEKSIAKAISNKKMFNLIHAVEGDKIDFWVLTNDPFDKSRFSRRLTEEVVGIKLQVSSPEDTILSKLKWSKLSGGSEKQFTDALRVFEVQYENLNLDYLENWVNYLDVKSLWKRLNKEAEII